MSQSDMYNNWLEENIDELQGEYVIDNPSSPEGVTPFEDGDPFYFFDNNAEFRKFCERKFEDICAAREDFAYEQWKENNL